VIAALQQQTSQLDAFLGQPSLPLTLAATPRDEKDTEELAAAVQCLAAGSGAPAYLPLAIIRPSIDWWHR
jgi:hypothetical protein